MSHFYTHTDGTGALCGAAVHSSASPCCQIECEHCLRNTNFLWIKAKSEMRWFYCQKLRASCGWSVQEQLLLPLCSSFLRLKPNNWFSLPFILMIRGVLLLQMRRNGIKEAEMSCFHWGKAEVVKALFWWIIENASRRGKEFQCDSGGGKESDWRSRGCVSDCHSSSASLLGGLGWN